MNDRHYGSSHEHSNFLNLSDLFSLCKKNAILILSVSLFGSILSSLYLQTIPITYKSTALIMIRDDQSVSKSITASSILSGRLSANPQRELFIAVLQSRLLSERVLEDKDITRDLLAIDGFNLKTKQPSFDSKIYDYDQGAFKNAELSSLWVNNLTNKFLTIENSGQNFLTLSFEHPSPIFAAQYINFLVEQANRLIRTNSLLEADAALEFLNSQLDSRLNSVIRSSISELALDQMEYKMRAFIYDDLIAKFIDPPFVPKSKFNPNTKLYIISGMFIGFLSILCLVVLNSVTIRLNKIIKI